MKLFALGLSIGAFLQACFAFWVAKKALQRSLDKMHTQALECVTRHNNEVRRMVSEVLR